VQIVPVKNGIIVIGDIRDRFFVEGSFQKCRNPRKGLLFHPDQIETVIEKDFIRSFDITT
jgi:hypothetical protein